MNLLSIRPISELDAEEISIYLQQLAALGKRDIGSDAAYVLENYVHHDDIIRCSVAEGEEGKILGLQVLKLAVAGNSYGVTPGWGMIGTHVHPDAAGRGVGRALFGVTRQAAMDAGLHQIDATIGAKNAEGLAYYEAMGFRTYRGADDKIRKVYRVT